MLRPQLEQILMASQYSCVYLTKREDGFMVHRGLAEKDGSIVIQMSGRKIIVVDRERKAFLRLFIIDYLKERMTVDVKRKNLSAIEHNQILDLSDEGERWEGDVWNDQPYGWGVLYDKDSNIAYEGFRLGDRNVCYGTEYYSDIGVINYRGGYFDGMRWGRGTHYDRNGSVVYEGNWMEDDTKFERSMRVDMNRQEEISFQNSIEVLEFCESRNERLEWQEPYLQLFPALRELVIQNNCFHRVGSFKLIGYLGLERVVIGTGCFVKNKYRIQDARDPNRRFCIKNCPKLRELKIGCLSFADYTVCEIEKVDALEVIEMGEIEKDSRNFDYASLELKSLTGVEGVMTRHAFAQIAQVRGAVFLRLQSRCV